MTGFGRGNITAEEHIVSVEIKTVNNRYLDLNLRLNQEMQPLEAQIKKMLSARLSRGRVDIYLNYERAGEINYELNRPLIIGYLSALKKLHENFDLTGEPDINVIARLPNVMQPAKDGLSEEFAQTVVVAFEQALTELDAMRQTEGESLKAELEYRLKLIEEALNVIEPESAGVAEEYRQRLTKRINEMLSKTDAQIEIDQGRLAQEVAFLSDRCDISEEIARLKSHIEQFRAIMGEEKDVGKRLDFLTQELNREANTITSKTTNMNIKNAALSLKSEIEKIREQVQNVE
jgi:uncharacterized protein (TIGR00255 family)